MKFSKLPLSITLLVACCLHGTLYAQQYAISAIPDTLLKDANLIKRLDEHRIQVKDAGKAVYHYKTAYTVLNEFADDASQNMERYDKFRKIGDINCALYDAMGAKIKTLKKSDIQDLPGDGAGTEISDDRIKRFGFYYKTYPYTVEYDVTIELEGLMFLPPHYFIETESMSVEHSFMEISFPSGMEVLYKTYNYTAPPAKSTIGANTVLRWELKNLPAVKDESYSPQWYELTPVVFLAMKEFSIGGYTGSNESWEAFGNFIYKLKMGRDELPPALKEKVHAIADGQHSKRKKVEAIYKFMQENTRYISVQLGIGGWQPFDAKYVYERKYGDCKALTNYMYALLKEAGIQSDYALIYAGANAYRVKTDFPSSQFNHVILSVPLEKDTLWLECTSQIQAPGYMSDFTDNRPALLVKEKGSCIVYTPRYSFAENHETTLTQIKLNPDGQIDLQLHTTMSGMLQDEWHAMMKHAASDEISSYLHRNYSIGTYTIKQFKFEDKPDAVPVLEQKIEIESKGYAQRTGKRLFIMPNIVNKHGRRLEPDPDRQYDVVIKIPYQSIDTVVIDIPAGFAVETIPGLKAYESPFGNYVSSAETKEQKLYYYRSMTMNGGRYPASAYATLVKWFADIYKADRINAVFVEQ